MAATTTAPLDQLVVQLHYLPTFLVRLHPGIGAPFAEEPDLTLYRDGTLVKQIDGHLFRAQLAPAEVEAVARRIQALGFDRLVDHTDECGCPKRLKGREGVYNVCSSDGSYTVLRAGAPLRTVVVYGGFWSDAKAAREILAYIEAISTPDAKPYAGDHATVVSMRVPEDRPPPPCTQVPPAHAKLFARPKEMPWIWPTAAEGAGLAWVRARIPGEQREATFCSDGKVYRTSLFEWLPGIDHAPAIAAWRAQTLTDLAKERATDRP